ncbi:MAG: hypothetical protein AAF358_05645 [Pseudomonadota bacterium]
MSIALAVASAVFTHLGVRHAASRVRSAFLAAALAAISVGFWFGEALGGFWPGFYTLLSVYFLTTVITPWVSYLRIAKHDR